MNELTQNMQTHCLGRFLIDLPKSIRGSTQQTVGYNHEVVIEVMGTLSLNEFNIRMGQIEAEYRAKKHSEGWPYFYSVSSPSPTIKLFERLESENELDDSARVIEGYKWSDDKVIKMVAKAIDVSAPKFQNDVLAKQVPTTTPQKRALLTDLLQRARSRELNDIPTEPGFCFEGGFLAGKADKEEEIRAVFDFKKMPDVQIRWSGDSHAQLDDTLLQRPGLSELISRSNGALLRKGVVKIPGVFEVEEWLMAGDMDQAGGKTIKGHYFKMEGNSKSGNPHTPFFEVVMENGGPIESTFDANGNYTVTPASLTEKEALALWDAVSKTIRMRPGAL
ncbi:T6SS immunity protein Tli4 family protein [Polaromonas sp.]|uniref:T6SS immunity protein Tli4 family protein n=1 Tax=Polaromonas sp. TaxID=1869339 RepID=UPI0025FF9E87|nr:T6SS immunity protein Tli4 family protein [Polaromonas sp.]